MTKTNQRARERLLAERVWLMQPGSWQKQMSGTLAFLGKKNCSARSCTPRETKATTSVV